METNERNERNQHTYLSLKDKEAIDAETLSTFLLLLQIFDGAEGSAFGFFYFNRRQKKSANKETQLNWSPEANVIDVRIKGMYGDLKGVCSYAVVDFLCCMWNFKNAQKENGDSDSIHVESLKPANTFRIRIDYRFSYLYAGVGDVWGTKE